MATLSTANSILALSVQSIFPIPVKIQGFAVDDSFSVDEVENAEIMMGVDKRLSAGFIPYAVNLDIQLMADSPSNSFFDTWIQQEYTVSDKYVASGTILLQGNGALYTFTRGFLSKFAPVTSAKKILQPRKYTITFESVSLGKI